MVEEIYKMKNEILNQAKKELEERGPDRIDVNRMGEMIDMVKDLAAAEESCWEAAYYRSVTEAMKESKGYSGYDGAGNNARQGYGQQTARQGYSSMGYGSMGYDEVIEKLGDEYRKLPVEERMSMKSKVLATLGSM